MSSRKPGLGRGLEALIPPASEKPGAVSSGQTDPDCYPSMFGLVNPHGSVRDRLPITVEHLRALYASIVEARGLAAVRDDTTLAPFVDAVVDENPEEANRFRAGEERLIGFFTGQVMRRAGKGADAKAVQKLLRERLVQDNSSLEGGG